MSQWWTYRPIDFLMFSARTYWRLVASYNRDMWPLQVLALAAGLGLLWSTVRHRAIARRIVPAALALAWLWVAWAFHWQRYATINWAAPWFAVAFAVQATLLLLVALARPPDAYRPALRHAGLALAAAAVLLYPMLRALLGRPWSDAEVFGLMPEPTALSTVGLLLATQPRHWPWLLAIPALSLMLGSATLRLMLG